MSYYLYSLIHYSCLMNSTPSADQLKKKKKKAETQNIPMWKLSKLNVDITINLIFISFSKKKI